MRPCTRLIFVFIQIILFGYFAVSVAQEPLMLSSKTAETVQRIIDINEVMGSSVGRGGQRPEQYDNFVDLKTAATTNELVALTEHDSAVVRCYAFWALTFRDSVELFPIVVNHLSDTTQVLTQFGCVGDAQRVADLFVFMATPGYFEADMRKLDSAQLRTLDSILIFCPYDLFQRNMAIERAETSDAFYNRLRELYLKEHSQYALVALAKYRKGQDVDLILRNPLIVSKLDTVSSQTYGAIVNFPHPRFFSLLSTDIQTVFQGDHRERKQASLYQAIAGYENEEALALLEAPLNGAVDSDVRKYHVDFIFDAVRERICPTYDDLLWKLWKEEGMITPGTLGHFRNTRPVDMCQSAVDALMDLDAVFQTNPNYTSSYYQLADTVVASLLDYVIACDNKKSDDIIARDLEAANVQFFPIFAGSATLLRRQQFIEPLFGRLWRDSNPYIYLQAASSLISYNTDSINERILKARNLNPNLSKDWGGKAFRKLLREHGLE